MASPQRRPDDGSEGDLPPDPWAGLAPDPPPVPADRRQRPGPMREQAGGPPPAGDPSWHPAGSERGTAPGSGARSVLGHPAVWVVLTLIVALALWAAWLDAPSPPPSEPSPGTVSTAPVTPPVTT